MPDRIRLEQVSKVYPGGNVALDDVSLHVEPGSFLVLLGPSGSGKTTLLRCLAGIERINSGTVDLGGRVVANGSLHLAPDRRNLSMVFQDYALWPHLVALDNVAFALRRRGLGKAARRSEAAAMLDLVGLDGLHHRYPNELSGGEQQRVALARALVARTGVILFDEPLSNLDADLRERMRIEISLLVRSANATTVYITHDQAEAFALGDRIGVLDHGRLVQIGTPEEIYTHPATSFVARFTGIAGELGVLVRARNGNGTVEVDPVGLELARPLHVRARNAHGPLGPAVLTIRPRAVSLSAPDLDSHHLVGVVADVAFRDRGYEYAIDLPNATRITGVNSPRRANRGEAVGLRFDTAGCLVFPG